MFCLLVLRRMQAVINPLVALAVCQHRRRLRQTLDSLSQHIAAARLAVATAITFTQ